MTGPRIKRVLRRFFWVALLPILLVLLLIAAVLTWSLRTPTGSNRLLASVPGLTVVQPQGSVMTGFKAQRIEWRGANGSRLTLLEPRWTSLRLRWAAHTRWRLALDVDELAVRQAVVHWVADAASKQPGQPWQLDLPMAIRVGQLSIDQLQGNLFNGQVLGPLQGSLDLQQAPAPGILTPPGMQHSLKLQQMVWQGWTLSGKAQLDARKPGVLQATLVATSVMDEAQVTLQGPLDKLVAQGQVRVKQRAPAPAASGVSSDGNSAMAQQTLQFEAQLLPQQPWPVASARINAQRFNLQRLLVQWPATALSGRVELQATNELAAQAQSIPDLRLHVDLRNDESGPWDAGRVPVAALRADVTLPGQRDMSTLQTLGRQGSVSGTLRLPVQKGAQGASPASVDIKGQWNLDQAQSTALQAILFSVDVHALHSRAPSLWLQGPVKLQGRSDASWQLSGDLQGLDRSKKALPVPVQAKWASTLRSQRVDLESLSLISGGAQAQAKGQWLQQPDGTWRVQGDVALQAFDPAVWLPWPRKAGDTVQATRLQGRTSLQLVMPAAAQWQGLKGFQGQGQGTLEPSRLLGVSTTGQWQWQLGARVDAQLQLTASGNDATLKLSMPTPAASQMSATAWQTWVGMQADARIQAPTLAVLQPWAQALGLNGLSGQLFVDGQWLVPAAGQWRTSGQARADRVQGQWASDGQVSGQLGGQLSVQGAKAQWAISALKDAASTPWRVDAEVASAQWSGWTVQQGQLKLAGLPAQHQFSAQARIDLPERKLPTGRMLKESVRAQWAATGQWQRTAAQASQWTAQVQTLKVTPLSLDVIPTWLDAQPFQVRWTTSPGSTQWQLGATRLSLLGATLSVDQAQWQSTAGAPGQVDLAVRLEPLRVAEVLSRWQPRAGWGGDLTLQGHLKASHRRGQAWVVDAQLSRKEGDLSLRELAIDGASEQRLGLRQIKLDLTGRDGVWTAQQNLDGRLLGTVQGRQVVQARQADALPDAASTLRGEISASIANVRSLAAWVPAGWRLAGQLTAQAQLAGTLGQPQYKGSVIGQKLGVSHSLLGVNLADGNLRLLLDGDHADLEELRFNGASDEGGYVLLTGKAQMGVSTDTEKAAQPTATLNLKADHFAVLTRVDRRATVSGDTQITLTADSIKVDGQLKVDDGLVDVSQADAPTVGDDVNVVNRPGEAAQDDEQAAPAAKRKWQVNLALDLGSKLKLKGRGLDALLSGSLRLSTPGGRAQLQGTIATADGTYVAYGQKLLIERGTLAFTGPVDNPRLDIRAMRAQSPTAASSDVKVGVLISGTALDPRVRLYSEPAMSETEKLSWLVLGRAPTGLGAADIGLLQTAASALLSGEGASPTDTLVSAIGLDELSVRQTDGAVRDTIVTVGKQISSRWYLGYERSLNATTGTWQAIYRLAQRFTLRAQTGDDNAVDLIWSWRWGF